MIPWRPTYLKLFPVDFRCFLQSQSISAWSPQWEHPLGALRGVIPDLHRRRVCLQVCKIISSRNGVSPILHRKDWNRKTLILLEDRFECCSDFRATHSGNHAMSCDNSTSHLNKIKISPELLNKCSIEFCRLSSYSVSSLLPEHCGTQHWLRDRDIHDTCVYKPPHLYVTPVHYCMKPPA